MPCFPDALSTSGLCVGYMFLFHTIRCNISYCIFTNCNLLTAMHVLQFFSIDLAQFLKPEIPITIGLCQTF